jgi:hypothetical protein
MYNPDAAAREDVQPVGLSDLLVDAGESVYMKTQPFGPDGRRIIPRAETPKPTDDRSKSSHLFCPTGLLDDVWWHRSYWVYGDVWHSGAFGYFQAGQKMPSGRPLVFDENRVYGYGRKPDYYRWTTPMEYHVFSAPKEAPPVAMEQTSRRIPPTRFNTHWTLDVPVLSRAMVLAGETLLVAGAPDLVDEVQAERTFSEAGTRDALARQAAALQGSEGGLLWLISTEGEKLAETRLKSVPVFDGMAVADGRVFLTTIDGKVRCLGAERTGRDARP